VFTGLFIVGCDSGSGDGGSPAGAVPLLGEPLEKTAASVDAARLLTQASFGVTAESLVDPCAGLW